MSKRIESKSALDYSNLKELLTNRTVIVGLNGGTNLTGEVNYIDADTLVLVTRPHSTLEIETKVVHTMVNAEHIDFIQFKTDRDV